MSSDRGKPEVRRHCSFGLLWAIAGAASVAAAAPPPAATFRKLRLFMVEISSMSVGVPLSLFQVERRRLAEVGRPEVAAGSGSVSPSSAFSTDSASSVGASLIQ